jgi:hypothetical protein
MVVVASMVVAFAILVEWQVLKISLLGAIGPILFLLSLITLSLSLYLRWKVSTSEIVRLVIMFGMR